MGTDKTLRFHLLAINLLARTPLRFWSERYRDKRRGRTCPTFNAKTPRCQGAKPNQLWLGAFAPLRLCVEPALHVRGNERPLRPAPEGPVRGGGQPQSRRGGAGLPIACHGVRPGPQAGGDGGVPAGRVLPQARQDQRSRPAVRAHRPRVHRRSHARHAEPSKPGGTRGEQQSVGFTQPHTGGPTGAKAIV